VGANIGAKLKVPAFEGCAFEGQFAEHSLSERVQQFADFLLVMNVVLVVGNAGPFSRSDVGLRCRIPSWLGGCGWENSVSIFWPLPVYYQHTVHKRNE
jgi:hypothetical protein